MPDFDTLYKDYAHYVLGLSLRLCGPGSDADDLFQEVYLRIYRFLPTYKGGSIKAWIRRITVNCYYSSVRAKRDAFSLDGEPNLHELVDPDLTTSGAVMMRQQRRQVHQAIQMLPEDSRQIMMMRDVEDLEYQEIARRLEIPIGTVRSRLARARQALRKSLEAYP